MGTFLLKLCWYKVVKDWVQKVPLQMVNYTSKVYYSNHMTTKHF